MKQIKMPIVICLTLLLCLSLLACQKQEGEDESGTVNAFSVVYNGVTLRLGASADTFSRLGEADVQREVMDCGEGKSRMYYRYSAVEIYTLKTDAGETIDQIEVNDDLSETSRGICIGDKESKVREAYGTPSSEKNGRLTYTKNDLNLLFDIENGLVADITLIRKTA